jgi:hypothetical protein
MTYVRKSIWTLENPNMWDPYTVGYASAVAAMKARPASDPTSWAYQAAMHGTYATPTQPLWNQCQHGTWYFLPWHRMYLYYFERICRAAAGRYAPADWALPYWNYSAGTPTNQLPPAFRQQQWTPPGGGGPQPNPLYTDKRNHNPDINGGAGLPNSVTSYAWAMSFTNFTGSPVPGFGGPRTGFSHEPTAFGALESQPHNGVHVVVGGDSQGDCIDGWMSDPNCAAQDPIFWLHHANIDRLWVHWISLGGGRVDPNDPAWSGFQFSFFDENRNQVRMTPAQVIDTISQLGYEYDDFAPLPFSRLRIPPLMAKQPVPPGPPPGPDPEKPPQLVAATEAPVELTGRRTDVVVKLPAEAQKAIATTTSVNPGEGYVYLNVEGLDTDLVPGVVYEVHVNLPDDADPAVESDQSLVGVISFFGYRRSAKATEDNPNHPLGPMSHTFDITGRVQRLREINRWNDEQLKVSFIPAGLEPESGRGGTKYDAPTKARPRVGRVSISYH